MSASIALTSRTVGHHAVQSRRTEGPAPSPHGVGPLSIRVYYVGDRPHWAIVDEVEPVVLFPPTATGYMRASALLDECRALFRFPLLKGTCPVTRTFCAMGVTQHV